MMTKSMMLNMHIIFVLVNFQILDEVIWPSLREVVDFHDQEFELADHGEIGQKFQYLYFPKISILEPKK